jgi:DNA-directed RNA polymerase specialized sigma24 family protein
LLSLARRRSPTPEAAEDAVQEALLRAADHWDAIDRARLGAWLNAVTVRICADQHREVAIERRRVARLLRLGEAVDPATAVADRCEDTWLVTQVGELPGRQQQALHVLADEGSVPAAAARLGVSTQAAEALVKRARLAMRRRLAATLAALLGYRSRRIWLRSAAAAGAVSAAAITSIALRPPHHGELVAPVLPRPIATSGVGADDTTLSTASVGGPRQRLVHSPPARSARPTPAPTGWVRVSPKSHASAGPVTASDEGTVVKKPDESLAKSLGDCLREGVVVNPSYVGCPTDE